MYNKVAEINHKIIELQKQRDQEITRMFNLGESDRALGNSPQYPDNKWYMVGWEDGDYQLEIASKYNVPHDLIVWVE